MKICFTILISLFTSAGYCQNDTAFKLIRTIEGNYLDFAADNLGNIILLDSDNQLKKLNANGDSVAVFNDVRRYGKVTSIDAANPLKILLYYRDFSTVVVLDRLLNPRNTIDLRQQNIMQARVICQSFDNGIWVYDENEAKLKRLADDGSIVDQTGDLRMQLDEAPAASAIADYNRLVYLYDSTKGLLVFDYFGTLKNKIAFLGWEDMQLVGKYIVGRKGTLLERYQLSTLMLEEHNMPAILKDVSKLRIGTDKLYCLRKGRIYIYAL